MDKKNKNPNVPNLRFLKFNQNYETLQLKNTLKIKSGKDQKQVEVENGIYNIYGTGGIIGHTNTFLYDKESVGIGRKGTIDKPVLGTGENRQKVSSENRHFQSIKNNQS